LTGGSAPLAGKVNEARSSFNQATAGSGVPSALLAKLNAGRMAATPSLHKKLPRRNTQ
jgi:hypothetical protein